MCVVVVFVVVFLVWVFVWPRWRVQLRGGIGCGVVVKMAGWSGDWCSGDGSAFRVPLLVPMFQLWEEGL